MSDGKTFGVLGGGSWATALVKILTTNQSKVYWGMRNESAITHLTTYGHNPNYLSDVSFDLSKLVVTNIPDQVVAACDVIIIAIPSAFVYDTLSQITLPLDQKIMVSAVKGIVPQSGKVLGEHLQDHFQVPFDQISVVAGPCHAEEVALERLSYLTIACNSPSNATLIANALKTNYIKAQISDDPIGTEYAVMLKNIYAIASGIAHGLGYGDNFQSVLISNAIREMRRFVKKIHKLKRNINNSYYLGDLLVTCYSTFSRNRLFGNMIGKGYTVKSAMMEMNMVAEGYYATKSAFEINDKKTKKTKLFIIDAVHAILYQNASPKKTFQKLTEQLN